MRIILATLSITFVNFFMTHCQPLCACVEYCPTTGEYTVDKSGSVEERYND